jgi:hypothetical protein
MIGVSGKFVGERNRNTFLTTNLPDLMYNLIF